MSGTLSDSGFYVAGGTLRPDAPSYVERQADTDLYEGLKRGEFCYVLHSRQMGKSSLMARTAQRFRDEGIAVVVLDLTAVGQNLSPEQWYDGLLAQMGETLGLADALDDFWLDHPRLGPLQRWLAGLRQVVLARVPGPIVLFIDEIDTVKSLPFSTDEFFAGIRECYNRRGQEPELTRLTFCLLGVASPSELIQDTRTTPFNIGRRIELSDFTEAEAAPLAIGLAGDLATEDTEDTERRAQTILRRVLHWTGGHPYLTQRLCRAIAEAQPSLAPPTSTSSFSVSSVTSVAKSPKQAVDGLCDALFLSPRARERDDNLLYVRDRLLRNEVDRAALLDLYAQVHRGKRVADDETNPLVTVLRLSGVTRAASGVLQLRNRIYARVFDAAWIATNMPDAELRRQRAAYRRGLVRAAAVATVIVAAMGGLALTAMNQARRANRISIAEVAQRRRAEEGQRALRYHLYATQTNLAAEALEANNVRRAIHLLNTQRPKPDEEDLRGFEWRLLWHLAHRDDSRAKIRVSTPGRALAYSPNGRWLASGGAGTVRLYDAATRRVAALLRGHTAGVNAVAFSADGAIIATASDDKSVRLWTVTERRSPRGVTVAAREQTLLRTPQRCYGVALSRDGRFVVVASGPDGPENHTVWVWQRATHRVMSTLKVLAGNSLALSPNDRLIAMGGPGGARLWNLATRRQIATLGDSWVGGVAFSPDAATLATGGNSVKLWDVKSARVLATLVDSTRGMAALAFSPDGGALAAGSVDRTIRLFRLREREATAVLWGHKGFVGNVVFSPDGKTIASTGDASVRFWSTERRDEDHLRGRHGGVGIVAISTKSNVLATGGLNGVKLWNLTTGEAITPFPGYVEPVDFLAISANGRTMAAGGGASVTVWDVPTRRRLIHRRMKTGTWFRPVAVTPDGNLVAFGDLQTIRLWDRTTRIESALPRVFAEGEGGGLNSLAISPDGSLLASGAGGNPTMKLWDLKRRRLLHTFTGYTNFSSTPSFSPNGSLLASYDGPDRGFRIWDVASKRLVHTDNRFSQLY